jgi:hypothetical protein
MKGQPYTSPLWKHVDLIRAMRRGHRTWPEIARCLEQEHGLKTSHKTVHGFFKRVVSRDKLPLGWAEREQPLRALPATDVDAKKETIDPLSTEVPDDPTELFTKWKKQQKNS